MKKLIDIYKKYKEQINYLIFGGLTTLINIVVYYLAYNQMHISNVNSNIIAWILSVLFAYITNKLWVFENRNNELKNLLFEVCTFFGCRLATGFMDLAIMYVTVDILGWYSLLMKVIANILVIVLNYIASKLVIFKKNK